MSTVTTDLGLKRLYISLRTTPSQAHTDFYLTWPFTIRIQLGFHMTVTRQCWRCYWHPVSGATIQSTQVVPLLRTHSVHPTHDLPLKLPHVSQVFLQQLANPHVIQAGWVWDEGETVDVWIHLQSWKGAQVKEESGWVVVEVLGIRILHLANLHCERWRMTFMSGSGRSRTRDYSLCGKKEKPTGLYFLVWSWSKKVKTLHVTAGLGGQMPLSAWIVEANALHCGGRRLWLWGQMPMSAWVDVFGVIMEWKFEKPSMSRRVLAGKCL